MTGGGESARGRAARDWGRSVNALLKRGHASSRHPCSEWGVDAVLYPWPMVAVPVGWADEGAGPAARLPLARRPPRTSGSAEVFPICCTRRSACRRPDWARGKCLVPPPNLGPSVRVDSPRRGGGKLAISPPWGSLKRRPTNKDVGVIRPPGWRVPGTVSSSDGTQWNPRQEELRVGEGAAPLTAWLNGA